MIHIEKGEFLKENPSLKVVTKTGDYEDTALIEFKDVNSEDELVAGAFQAQFVRYGSLVYRFNDPKELGAEILKIDPESTHAAASFVRINEELLRQLNNGSLEPSSLDEALVAEKQKVEEIIEPVEPDEIDIEPIRPDVPTTTPPTTSTTTPPVVDIPVIDLPTDTSTTTTPVMPTVDVEPTTDLPTIDVGDTVDTITPAADELPASADSADTSIIEDVLEVVSPQVSDIVSSIKKGISKAKKVSKVAKNIGSTKKKR